MFKIYYNFNFDKKFRTEEFFQVAQHVQQILNVNCIYRDEEWFQLKYHPQIFANHRNSNIRYILHFTFYIFVKVTAN